MAISQTSSHNNKRSKLPTIFAQSKFKRRYFAKVYSRFSRDGKMASFTSQTRPLRRETSQQRQPEVILAVTSLPLAVPDVCRCQILSSLITDVEPEIELILGRVSTSFSSKLDLLELTICPRHRSSLGIGWRRGSNLCRVPPPISKHGGQAQKNAKAERGLGKSACY